jgi:hypothetical protein
VVFSFVPGSFLHEPEYGNLVEGTSETLAPDWGEDEPRGMNYYYSSAKFYQDATNSFEMLKHYSGN